MDDLLNEAGLVKARLMDADGSIPIAAIEAMFPAVYARYPDPLMGLHLASDIQPATFGAMGFIWQACTTLADVLETTTRYNGLLSNIGKSSVLFTPGTVQVCWECSAVSAPLKRHATEYVLGAFSVLARMLLPEKKDVLQAVHFAHTKPEDPSLIGEYFSFFKCPVYFDKPASCVVFASSILKTKMRHGDAFMKDALDHHAQNILKQRKEAVSLPDEVHHLIGAMIVDGVPTLDMVAEQLGTSDRSLHRKLKDLGTGYREILDQVRLELSQARLRESTDSVSQIASYLGFQSHQAFLRWFKHSTGKTPGEYRKEMTAGANE